MVQVATRSNTSRPAAKVLEYEFSLSRSRGQFRWIHRGEEYFSDWIVGDVWCRRADGDTGRLYLVGELDIGDDGTTQVYPPTGEILEALRAETVEVKAYAKHGDWADFPQGFKAHWRLCLDRARKMWRIRDEAHPNVIWNTNGYRGMVHLSRMDGGPHVHAYQPAWLDSRGVVQFGG